MTHNNIDISIAEKKIRHGDKSQPLTFEKFSLVHSWSRSDMYHALYTFQELYTPHRNFGHPSTNVLANLLSKADPGNYQHTKKYLEEMRSEFEVCDKASPLQGA